MPKGTVYGVNCKAWVLCCALGVFAVGCGADHSSSSPVATTPDKPPLKDLVTKDIKVGSGPSAEVNDFVYVEYTGKLANGVQFDSNAPQDPKAPDTKPFSFQLVNGKASVIAGWNEGLIGMKVGGERELEIPYRLGYGDAGQPPKIPAQADLYFDVKLLGLVRPGHENEYYVSDIVKGTGREATPGTWATITYKATLVNGFPIADSKDGTVQFNTKTGDMGNNETVGIKGVVAGVNGMKVGGERVLTLPPTLGIQPSGPNPEVPPNSMVKVDIKLVRVLDKQGPPMKAPK